MKPAVFRVTAGGDIHDTHGGDAPAGRAADLIGQRDRRLRLERGRPQLAGQSLGQRHLQPQDRRRDRGKGTVSAE